MAGARFESLHGGLGVMADDAMAGVYGHLLMRVLVALAPAGLAGMSGGARRTIRTAAIVAVGSELLGTTRLDTNSLYLTEQLNRVGIDVVCKAVVGDDRDDCAQVVRSFVGARRPAGDVRRAGADRRRRDARGRGRGVRPARWRRTRN